jgi:SAM-dependent methyltransferase
VPREDAPWSPYDLAAKSYDQFAVRRNLYDDPQFFAEYTRMRSHESGLHELLILPCLPDLLPELAGKRVLDLGCGDGWFCRYAAAAGASTVIGVDPSLRMLGLAGERTSIDLIRYVNAYVEDVVLPDASADVVVSILALHYVAELDPVLAAVARWLDRGGTFVGIVEHPIFTAQRRRSGWITEEGRHVAWPVGDYFDEGARITTWFVDGVVRYHRSVSTTVNAVRNTGLTIDQLVEPRPSISAVETTPGGADELVRPALLGIRAVKSTRAS